ncbi:hypothetical protein [Acidianus sp.]|uniref:hypothetical protein n=1 Tax=Acidianus sp. TaxID=1872104 RepID=UPI00397E738E
MLESILPNSILIDAGNRKEFTDPNFVVSLFLLPFMYEKKPEEKEYLEVIESIKFESYDELNEIRNKDFPMYATYFQQKVLNDYISGKAYARNTISFLLNKFKDEKEAEKIKEEYEDFILDKLSLKEFFKPSSDEEPKYVFPYVWRFYTPNFDETVKKVTSGKEIVSDYMGLTTYVILVSKELFPFFRPYVFLSNSPPRIGLKMGEVLIDPEEIIVTQLNEDRLSFSRKFLEKELGKLESKELSSFIESKSETSRRIILSSLRYANWALKKSGISLEDAVHLFVKLRELIDDVERDFQKAIDNGVDFKEIKEEVKKYGWLNLEVTPAVNPLALKKSIRIISIMKEIGDMYFIPYSIVMSAIVSTYVSGKDYKLLLYGLKTNKFI